VVLVKPWAATLVGASAYVYYSLHSLWPGSKMIITKWVNIKEVGKSASGKTIIWDVFSSGEIFLGEIRWFASWRKYVFLPLNGAVFEEDCMRDIANWCEQATRRHKAK